MYQIISKIFIFSLFLGSISCTCRKIISTPLAPPPVFVDGNPIFNQGVLVDNTLYVSGQLGMNTDGNLAPDFERQTKLALDNVGHILREAGSSYNRVAKVTILLSDITTQFGDLNVYYAKYFNETPPVRTAFQAGKLPGGPNALIEIEAIAFVDEPVVC